MQRTDLFLPISEAEADDFLDYMFEASNLIPSVLRAPAKLG